MAQMERVSWRTVGYSMLGATAIIAGTVGIVRSDGVRPTSLKSNSATRWLVDQPDHLLVLADGLTGKLLAKIDTGSTSVQQQAYQGVGGAFLVVPDEGSVRPVSTAKLQLGTAQKLAPLSEPVEQNADLSMGVGANGLTVVNTETDEASLVGSEDAPRPIELPDADTPLVARDGSIWLFQNGRAVHVNVDGSSHSYDLAGTRGLTATVGPHAVYVDARARTLHWIDGGTVDISAIPNLADAIIQQPRGEDAPCVWLGVGDSLYCVGKIAIERTVRVPGLEIVPDDRVAVAGNVAAIVHTSADNRVERVDLGSKQLIGGSNPDPPANGPLTTMIAVNGIVWIDDTAGHKAWSVHDLGFETINKNDQSAPLLDAQGQEQQAGSNDGGSDATGGGNVAGPDEQQTQCDTNGQDNSPVAVDDQVTARAGNTIIIPVTANDYDPDCPPPQAIALFSVGLAGHGIVDVLDGTSVSYVPEQGYSGTDSFEYTIVDETGLSATGTVNIELFSPDSPNRPPITNPDHATTGVGRSVIVDVLANDIDPERDLLAIPNFSQSGGGTITEAKGPSGLPALRFDPPPGESGRFTFTYQAADPQGATSANTEVSVDVAPANARNDPPTANPDAIRLKVGVPSKLNVKANDFDPDGDELSISAFPSEPGVDVKVVSDELVITLLSGAKSSRVVRYTLSDGIKGHETTGRVLVLRVDDSAPNRPPVANPDTERVVVGNSVKIPVIANDRDPDGDTIRLIGVDHPKDNAGTTAIEGDSVRFTPTLSKIDQSTPVSFTYSIGDGHGNTATGTVTVTVLAEALPRPPYAGDDKAETWVDTPVTIDVLNNDGDPSGGKPSLIGKPVCQNGGDAVVTDDARVTFTPPSGQINVFRCRYRVGNSQGRTAEASIIVTVVPRPAGNHAPVISPSTLRKSMTIGDQFTFTASSLATDEDNDTLVFSTVAKPTLGSTNFGAPASSFTYTTPAPNNADVFPLLDSIPIQISDGHDGVANGEISIQIFDKAATPPPPTAPQTHQILKNAEVNSAISVNVVSELAEANQGVRLSLSNASAAIPSQASVTFGSDGVVSITPRVSGQVIVNYTVQNLDNLLKDSNQIVVTVTEPPPVNPPAVAHDDSLTVSSGGSGQKDVLLNDDGIRDPGDVVSATLDNLPPSAFGSATLVGGIFTFIANPTFSGGGSVLLTYTVSDGHSSSKGNISVRLEACTDSPPQAAPDPHLFTPYVTPIDIDLGAYVVSGTIDPTSIHGAMTTVSGTYTPPAGENGVVQILFDVVNACGQVDQGVVTIDVNRAPTGLTPMFDITPGATLTVLPGQIASDNEALTIVSLAGQPDWVTRAADGSSITASPPAGTATSVTFTAVVSDPGGLTATATITLNLTNLPPIAHDDAYNTTESLITLDPTQNDVDPEGRPLTIYSVTTRDPNRGTVVSFTDRSVILNVAHGVSVFDYTIKDSGGLTAAATITVTSNHPPTMADVSGETSQSTLSVTLSPTDPDSEDLGSLSTTCAPLPGWDVQLVKDPASGQPPIPDRLRALIMVAPGTAPGVYSFPCTTRDPLGATATATVTVTVDAP